MSASASAAGGRGSKAIKLTRNCAALQCPAKKFLILRQAGILMSHMVSALEHICDQAFAQTMMVIDLELIGPSCINPGNTDAPVGAGVT